jgi:predicted DNA-binding protein YlxM (UPF0122 family)
MNQLEGWINKYCTAKQAKVIRLGLLEDKEEKDIAQSEGITQQAVSKGIKAGIQNIRKGLKRDGLLREFSPYEGG